MAQYRKTVAPTLDVQNVQCSDQEVQMCHPLLDLLFGRATERQPHGPLCSSTLSCLVKDVAHFNLLLKPAAISRLGYFCKAGISLCEKLLQ